jgi:hypothetical protein
MCGAAAIKAIVERQHCHSAIRAGSASNPETFTRDLRILNHPPIIFE